MAKKKDKANEVNPYEEMDSVVDEFNETLDKTDRPKKEEETEQPQEPEKDYLDEPAPQKQNTNRNYSQPLMFNDEKDENLIRSLMRVDWERIEHIIRGHKPKVDNEGNEYFVSIEGHYLNEYGVNSILHFLSFYLSKEIFLARYSMEQVEMILKQFSIQFIDFFYDNVEEFGLNTPEKKKMSKMFVQSVIDLVDASYSKAIEGKTAELTFKQFQVLQQQPLNDNSYNNNGFNNQSKKPSIMQRIFG